VTGCKSREQLKRGDKRGKFHNTMVMAAISKALPFMPVLNCGQKWGEKDDPLAGSISSS
jgi:hypothetical protein